MSPKWITRCRLECAKLDLMTKSAKQDTNEGPAETAETESAATTGCLTRPAAKAEAGAGR